MSESRTKTNEASLVVAKNDFFRSIFARDSLMNDINGSCSRARTISLTKRGENWQRFNFFLPPPYLSFSLEQNQSEKGKVALKG